MIKKKYVYLTTNLINGKQYIGQHEGLLSDSYISSGVAFLKAVKKYGKSNFKKEILQICLTQEELNNAEKYWIDKYNAVSDKNFYNIAEGGLGGNPLAGLSKEKEIERRRKISEALKGDKNPFYKKGFYGEDHPMWGKHHTQEAKNKMRLKKLGKTLTEEHKHKNKISENNKNKIKNQMYDKDNNYIRDFCSLRDVNRYFGLSSKSTYRLRLAINNKKLYHSYYFKEEAVSTILGTEE